MLIKQKPKKKPLIQSPIRLILSKKQPINPENSNSNKALKIFNHPLQNREHLSSSIIHPVSTNTIIPIHTNQKIQRLAQELFPKLEHLEKQKKDHPHHRTLEEEEAQALLDSYTSQRKFENKMSMNAAQRELDQRLKNKMIERSKRASRDSTGGDGATGNGSYLEMYQKIRKELEKGQLEEEIYYEMPEVSPEGINFYQHLKYRPALLKYTQQKIRMKQLKNGLSRHSNDIFSLPLLKILTQRKKKPLQVDPSAVQLKQKQQKQQYIKQLLNIDKISSRLKRIYTKHNLTKINDPEIQEIQNSNIIRHQHQILEELGDGDEKISKKNKEKLINQFNSILGDYGRSSAGLRSVQSRAELLKTPDRSAVKISRVSGSESRSRIKGVVRKRENVHTTI